MAKDLRVFKHLVRSTSVSDGSFVDEYMTHAEFASLSHAVDDEESDIVVEVLVRDVEFPDDTPVEVPIAFQQPYTLEEQVQRCLMRGRINQYQQLEIVEEGDEPDFGDEGDDSDMTIHEMAGDEEMMDQHRREKERVKAQMAEEAKAYVEFLEARKSRSNADPSPQPAAAGSPPALAAGGPQAAA